MSVVVNESYLTFVVVAKPLFSVVLLGLLIYSIRGVFYLNEAVVSVQSLWCATKESNQFVVAANNESSRWWLCFFSYS